VLYVHFHRRSINLLVSGIYVLTIIAYNCYAIRGISDALSIEQVCRYSLLSDRNVRWSHRIRMLLPLSHGEYIDGIDKQTDGCHTVTLRFPPDALT